MKICADSSHFWFAIASSNHLYESATGETNCAGNAARGRTLRAPAGAGMGLVVTGFNWHTQKQWHSLPIACGTRKQLIGASRGVQSSLPKHLTRYLGACLLF